MNSYEVQERDFEAMKKIIDMIDAYYGLSVPQIDTATVEELL